VRLRKTSRLKTADGRPLNRGQVQAATGKTRRGKASGSAFITRPAAYQQLYDQSLVRLPGIRSLRSTILMKQVVPLRPLPTHSR
jgi:hypothetical protein